jgi:hypothetical protein
MQHDYFVYARVQIIVSNYNSKLLLYIVRIVQMHYLDLARLSRNVQRVFFVVNAIVLSDI